MGNDDEIKQLIRHESESFLKHALVQSKGSMALYDVDTEFGKTRHNKSFVVIGATALTILILAVAAVLVTRTIEQGVARAPIDIGVFEDLNLKDILDSSKRNQNDLTRAKLELSQLDDDLKSGLGAADRDYQAAVESIQALNLGKTEESQRMAEAAIARDATKQKLSSSHTAAAAKKREEIAAIQKRIDEYDSRSLAQAKQQQATLANERTAFDIEQNQQAQLFQSRIAEMEAARKRDVAALTSQKDELAASLTARYNPKLTDTRSAALLTGWISPVVSPPAPFHPYLGPAGILDSAAEAKLDQSFSNLEYLTSRLQAVPYINSVPAALSRIEGETRLLVAAYRAALQAAGSDLLIRDQTIAALTARAEAAEASLGEYRQAVAEYARYSHEDGFVIDATDNAKLLLCLDPGVSAQNGDIGYIVRGNESIGNIVLSLSGDKVYAQTTRIMTKPRIFDSIIIAASREAAK